jgi:hypothetical protein
MGTATIYLLVLGGIGFYIWSLRGSSQARGGAKKTKLEPVAPPAAAPNALPQYPSQLDVPLEPDHGERRWRA